PATHLLPKVAPEPNQLRRRTAALLWATRWHHSRKTGKKRRTTSKPGVYALLRCLSAAVSTSARASAGECALSRVEFGALSGRWLCIVMHACCLCRLDVLRGIRPKRPAPGFLLGLRLARTWPVALPRRRRGMRCVA